MDITTHLELTGQAEELDYMLGYMIPVNIAMTVNNKIYLNMTDSTSKLASGITFCNIVEITDNFNEKFEILGQPKQAGMICDTKMIEITDNFNENIQIENNINIGNTIIDTMSIEITDNFNEKINIENKNRVGSNMNLTEII